MTMKDSSNLPPYLPLPSLENLERRGRILRSIRSFFAESGYIEVETPIRILAPAPEAYIECPEASGAWLRASPELQMKRLMAAGANRIYQMGACFRQGERGAWHNSEFTMLEWYRAGSSAKELQAECRGLILRVCGDVLGTTRFEYDGRVIDLSGAWEVITVQEAYREWAGWDPLTEWDSQRFSDDMALKIEPGLPRTGAVVLSDYPAQAASLARLAPHDSRVAERWELYIGGVEIANAYVELNDAREQRRRFEAAKAERRGYGAAEYPMDEDFLADLAGGRFPECSGIALGVDRLVMLLCDARRIDQVRPFCPPQGGVW